VHFLEQLGAEIGTDLFERMRFAWVDGNGQMQFDHKFDFTKQVQAGTISDDTLVADTLVQNKAQLAEKWLVPFGRSWHKRIV
jgi:hypothetical protein